ncbi:MAG: 23S rRNA (adenine(2503)-C(2))-methyltransferase RlmN [Bacteroidota bacterium]|nr:23S rRNA (adenine(2503)-C(2))-methyltransferase RlmN [Bacteroidota bacterium]
MTEKMQMDIRTFSKEDLKLFFEENNEKGFRGQQVYEWLWKKGVRSFEEMTNLSKDVRKLLSEKFVINALQVEKFELSKDGTKKFVFRLFDGNIIEGVLIPGKERTTACISSQVGCNLGCRFCATSNLKFRRNLNFDEIFDQISILNAESLEIFKMPLSNIVFMGMGEPLLNYDNVMKAISIITSDHSFGFSPKRITVSTVGIPKMIRKLGDDKSKINLAVSLHCANDKKRSRIIPFNSNSSLNTVKEAIEYYYDKTSNRVTFEYILLKDFNDSITDARELAEFCKFVPCKVNVIEYNSVTPSPYQKSSRENTDAFTSFLESRNMIITVRRSKGQDINAACGQLAGKITKS